MKVLHVLNSNFEGIACAILSKYIFGDNIELHTMNDKASEHDIKQKIASDNYSLVIISMGQKEIDLTVPAIQSQSFKDLYNKLSIPYADYFDNQTLKLYYENICAYLDWSWNSKKLYLGKNLDDLSKIMDRSDIIDNVANRIIDKELIVSSQEKKLLKLEKTRLSKYIEERKYMWHNTKDIKALFVYAEKHMIETANTLIQKDVDIVFVIDMNAGIVIIKYNQNKAHILKKKLEDIGATLTRTGSAYLNIGRTYDNTITNSIAARL
ncbi:MAG: hypothetical protein ACRDB0_08465 [Paraclostridium sp.]